MRDLTMHDLDAQLAEQLPARELMQATAVAIGALAANISTIHQTNVANYNSYSDISQSNSATVYQSASASNSGAVTAAAVD
jgi:hypothetical protein